MLLSSHTFSFSAYYLRQGHKFKDNSISSLSYPKALARFYSHTPTIRHRPHYLTLATFYEVSLTAPQPSVPFSYLLRRKDEKPNVNFTNSKLLANHIYLWYNNTVYKTKKTKYRKQLSKMETHFAGFLFSKNIRKENIMTEIIIKTTSIIYNIMKLLVRLYIKSFDSNPYLTTFCTIFIIVRYLFFP